MDTYRSIYCHGLVRVGGVTVPVHLADPSANAAEVIRAARACHEEAVAVAVFPVNCQFAVLAPAIAIHVVVGLFQ